jgi:hypothetical protein
MKRFFLLVIVYFNSVNFSIGQMLDSRSEESKFSYYFHKQFDIVTFYSDTNFLEKPAFLNVVFKFDKKYKVTFVEIFGRANEKMKTEIEAALRKAIKKENCDTLNLKKGKYYSFPLLFRVSQVSVSYDRARKIDKEPKEYGEGFKERFYDDLITSFNEYKNLKLVFDKPVILLPIVDLETDRIY